MNMPQQQQQQRAAPPQKPGQQAPPQQQQQPPPPPVLPKGWKREVIYRMRGITAGLGDVQYVPNETSELSQGVVGKKFKSKVQLQRHFGNKFDVSLLDFRTGKLNPAALRKQRRVKSIAANPNNYLNASKYDNYLYIPTRQTNSVLNKSVCVLANQKNDPTPSHVLNGPNTKPDKHMPTQLFWELRFNKLRGVDADLGKMDELRHTLESTRLAKCRHFLLFLLLFFFISKPESKHKKSIGPSKESKKSTWIQKKDHDFILMGMFIFLY